MREAERIIRALGEVDDKYIEEAAPGKKKRTSVSWKVLGWVAACVVILLSFSAVAYAANWFGLRDLLLSSTVSEEKGEQRIISLSGYQESAEWQALAEWNRWVQEYGVQIQPDEISERYGLKLHTECNVIHPEELMYRVGGYFMDKELLTWAYMYEDGYFHVEGSVELQGTGNADFQLIRNVKGTFNEVVLHIDEIENYAEWQYRTVDDEIVLLAIAPEKALIFADYTECFLSVNVLSGSKQGMTKESLQELADRIDFSVLKNVKIPEMRGDSIVGDAEENGVQETEDAPVLKELVYGNIGKVFGVGTLVYTVPQNAGADYKVYFFAAKTEEEKYLSMEERKLNLADATYVFPDVRNGNIAIGTFQELYFFEIEDLQDDGIADILLVARYEGESGMRYDTRVYVGKETGYVPDEIWMDELNEAYSGVKEYPVLEVLEKLRN